MIAVDTNVLVRIVVGDDAQEVRLATAMLKQAAERGEPVYVPTVILAEMAWVLTTVYRVNKAELIAVLKRLLREDGNGATFHHILIESRDAVSRAIDDFIAGRADFADYLIGRVAQAAGATTTYTFDRAASAAPTFKLLRGHRG